MSNLDEINHALAKAARDRARLERALAPGRSMTDLVKAIQSPLHVAAIAEIAKAMQPPAHLTAVSQMMTAMQREHGLFAELTRPPRFLDDVTKQIAQMRSLSASITAPYHAIQEIIRSQYAVFEGLSAQVTASNAIKFSIPQFSQATLAWNVAS